MLYLVPTPIGNLEDITLRAIRVLKEVDLILAEDTRTSRKLLDHLSIETPLKAFHAHNEHQVTTYFVELMQAGRRVALVSDAGTPGISDPGFLLVRACVQANIEVCCLPGPSALIPALVVSGLSCDRFHFEGFLPHKKGRQTRLKYLSTLDHTVVLYESPHRLVKCLDELAALCGPDRPACVCRELSKRHEEIHRGSLDELKSYFAENPDKVRGEMVLVIDRK
ncbi:MAG: 16S rRNA (cytidine(1402)-2'-O)-methyltransferase [Haliscomenobacter sp.]